MDDFFEEDLLYALLLSFSGFALDFDETPDLVDDDDELNVALINII